MQILELEEKYSELKSDLSGQISKRTKLLKISGYLGIVLSNPYLQIIEPYIIDFIPNYLHLLDEIEIRGLSPSYLSIIKNQLSDIKELNLSNFKSEVFDSTIKAIDLKLNSLTNWLNNHSDEKTNTKIYFPLIDKNDDISSSGYLESISIVIKSGDKKFHISPSELENDEQLEKQIDLCCNKTIEYCRQYIKKIKENHTIYIYFENKLGVITGNSLGTALTLLFIEAFLKYYNSPVIVNISKCIAITGGLDLSSKILSTSKIIIQAKTEAVFFSEVKVFCVPKIAELWAEEKIAELKILYPAKELKIIGLTDLDDLLSRRNIIDIHKKNWLQRIAGYLITKWKSIILALIITFILSFIFVLDFDDNPAMFLQENKLLQIKNKNGKVLWTVVMNFDPLTGLDQSTTSRKIVDIDEDGTNEVLICEENLVPEMYNYGRLACYNYKKQIIWEYTFRDTVSTFRRWNNLYHISIIDTITLNNRKLVVCSTRNIPNFPSAVFKLDLLTGNRVDSLNTFWNAGTLNNGIIGDYNKDGRKEIVLGGLHNGFQRAILVSIDIESLSGQTPSPERYKFINKPLAKVNQFILLPNSDYGKLYARSNSVAHQHLYFKERNEEFETATIDGSDKGVLFYYGFDKYLNLRWIDCGDDAQLARDSLVAKGVLNKPFTNTNEYFELLRKQIQYWDGEKFISIDERKK